MEGVDSKHVVEEKQKSKDSIISIKIGVKGRGRWSIKIIGTHLISFLTIINTKLQSKHLHYLIGGA